MKRITAQSAPKLARPSWYLVTLAYTLLITVIVTAQLFDIDKLVEHEAFYSSGGILFLAGMAVVGVFSLPYVLRLECSVLLRLMSFVCAAILPLYWLAYVWRIQGSQPEIGILGTHLSSPIVTFVIVGLGYILATTTVIALGAPRLKKHP